MKFNRLLIVLFLGSILSAPTRQSKPVENPARLIPRDVVACFQFQNLQDAYAQLNPYLGKLLGEQAGKNLKNLLIGSIETGIQTLPEEFRNQLYKLLPALDSMHLAIFELSEKRFEWLVLARLKGEATWQPFLDAAGKLEPKLKKPALEYEKVGIYRSRGMRGPWAFAWTGDLAMIASDDRWIRQAIARSLGKDKTPSVLENLHFKDVLTEKDHGLFMAGFFDLGRFFEQLTQDMSYYDRRAFDEWDALFNVTGMKAVTMRMAMKDGTGIFKGTATAEPDCTAFQFILQKPAGKETLAMIPQDSLFSASVTATDPSKSWNNFKDMVARHRGNFASSYMNRFLEDDTDDIEMADEIFRVCGTEATMAVTAHPDFFRAFDRGTNVVFIFKPNDPEKLAAIFRKTMQLNKSKDYASYTIDHRDDGWNYGAAAVVDGFFLLTPGKATETLEKIIDAHKDKKTLTHDAAFMKSYGKIPQKNSVLMSINIKGWLSMLEKELSGVLPIKVANKVQDPWDFFVTMDTDTVMNFEYHGAGAPLLALAGIPSGFLAIEEEFGYRRGGDVGDNEEFIPSGSRPKLAMPESPEEMKKLLDRLSGDLASPKLKTRDEATKALIALGNNAKSRAGVAELMKTLLKSSNPEVASRAQKVQWEIRDFSHLSEKEIQSRISSILTQARGRVISWSRPSLQTAGLTEQDIAFLESDPAQAILVRTMLSSKDEDQFTALHLMVWAGRFNRSTVQEIVKSLDHPDPQTRFHLAFLLKKHKNPPVKYNAFWDLKRRKQATESYQKWFESKKEN